MGPKKKQKPKNDFYFFMMDMKKQVEWSDMTDLAAKCSPSWNKMPAEEKERYKQRAKEAKERQRLDLSNRFDHQGRSLLEIEEEKAWAEADRAGMLNAIDDVVGETARQGTIVREKFYIIHFNVLCVTVTKQYLPCEYAIVEYCLQRGITRILHGFVNPPEVPMGYAYEIQKNSDKTHNIDLDIEPMQSFGAKDHEWIVKHMLDLLDPVGRGKSMPPLYTIEDEVEKTRFCLSDLFHWAGHERNLAPQFRVFELHELYHRIVKELPRTPIEFSRHMANHDLKADVDSLSYSDACPFHEFKNCFEQCSMALARKWCYVMSKHICPFYSIPLIPSRHVPSGALTDEPVDKPEIIRLDFNDYSDGQPHNWVDKTDWGAPKTRARPSGHSDYLPTTEVVLREGSSRIAAALVQKEGSTSTASDSQSHETGNEWWQQPTTSHTDDDFWSPRPSSNEPPPAWVTNHKPTKSRVEDNFWSPRPSNNEPPPAWVTPKTQSVKDDFPALGGGGRRGKGAVPKRGSRR